MWNSHTFYLFCSLLCLTGKNLKNHLQKETPIPQTLVTYFAETARKPGQALWTYSFVCLFVCFLFLSQILWRFFVFFPFFLWKCRRLFLTSPRTASCVFHHVRWEGRRKMHGLRVFACRTSWSLFPLFFFVLELTLQVWNKIAREPAINPVQRR